MPTSQYVHTLTPSASAAVLPDDLAWLEEEANWLVALHTPASQLKQSSEIIQKDTNYNTVFGQQLLGPLGPVDHTYANVYTRGASTAPNRPIEDSKRLLQIKSRIEAMGTQVATLQQELAAARGAVQAIQQQPVQQLPAQQQQPTTTNVVTQPTKNTGLVVAGVAIFAGLVGVGVWWWYRNQKMAGAREGDESEMSEPLQLTEGSRARRRTR